MRYMKCLCLHLAYMNVFNIKALNACSESTVSTDSCKQGLIDIKNMFESHGSKALIPVWECLKLKQHSEKLTVAFK